MRHTTAALTAALLLTLSACSESDNPPSTPSAKPGQSAATEQPAADGKAALETAVRAYSDAYFKPDTAAGHAMLSARCKEQLPAEVYGATVEAGAKAYGKQEIKSLTVDQLSGDLARVTYSYSVPLLDQKSQPWAREGGQWKYDAC